jgi:acyl-CoA synthetase (AMP-forming)/AMP-acid ligase II/alkylation response protein AidB-like acyl-CoA dehydrogenase/acyl carrier protein
LLFIESSGREANSFTDVLVSRAQTHADRRAYVFLRDGEDEEATMTFGQLHGRALAVAEQLMSLSKPGDRAVLLYPAGLEFIVTFFGCLYAGVIPVPVTVPNRRRGFEIVSGIAQDSGARWILSTGSLLDKFDELLEAEPELAALPRLDTDQWPTRANALRAPLARAAADTGLLQYTSGSTGSPRGVVVTHANLIDNQKQIEQSFQHDQDTVILSWLPMFHDMGLGTVLQALWMGVHCVLMSPSAFLQKPSRWLRAISRYRATSSGGPDFAYDLCVRRVSAEERAGLDLSSWRMAYNGSEPVRATTLRRFSEAFGPFGFKSSAFHNVYGLAEATLFVSGGQPAAGPIIRKFSRQQLEQGQGTLDAASDATELVSCGAPWLDGRITIVNPETNEECGPGQVGEIWVMGPSVAAGYWNKPTETDITFNAHTASDEGPFLRSGDLGFTHDRNLFITGRYKDLIIVRGLNHYPQDLEVTVAECHPALEPGACGAFSIEVDDVEQLVVVQEVRRSALRTLDAESVFRAIRAAVADRHGLNTHGIALLRPGGLPRTSSGKVRRKVCRQAFLAGTLGEITSSTFGIERLDGEKPSRAPLTHAVSVAPHQSLPSGGAARPQSADAAASAALAAKAADRVIDWLRRYSDTSNDPQATDVLRSLPPPLLLDFARQGLFGMQVETRYGGLGLGHAETARVLEQLAAIDLNAGLFVGLNNYLGVTPIARHATPRLKQAILSGLARDGQLAGFALAEPGVGSNPSTLAAYAEPINGSGWRLFGRKYASGPLQGSGYINVFTRHRDREGVTAFVVPQTSTGVKRPTQALAHGTQGLARNEVTLDGVALGHDYVLGRPGHGMEIALEAMAHSRLAVAAACLGGMKRCAQLVFHYATQRQTPTGRLVAHPVTLAKLGRVTAGVTALECLVQQLARATDSGTSVPTEAFTVCKVAAPEMLWQVVDDLVQLLGRRGYVETPHIRNLVRDAQALRSCEGPTEAMSALLGARLMGGGDANLTLIANDVLGAPSVAPLVARAVGAIRARLSSGRASKEALYWSNARAGELTTWIALLAAVEGRRSEGTSGELERAVTWARANFERTLSMVETGASSEVGDQDAIITDSVAAYSRSIGEADALLLWDEHALHPVLQHADLGEPPASSRRLDAPRAQGTAPGAATTTGDQLRAWVVTWLAQKLRVSEAQINPNRSFADHGLDSLAAVELAKALSDRLSRSLDETLLWNFATIDALVEYLEGSAGSPEPPPRPSSRPPGAPAEATSDAGSSELEDEIARLERELRRR